MYLSVNWPASLIGSVIKSYKHINVSIMGTPSASIPQNQREAPLPAGLSRWRSGIAVGHVTEGSWVRFPLETSFFPKKLFRYYKLSFFFILGHSSEMFSGKSSFFKFNKCPC